MGFPRSSLVLAAICSAALAPFLQAVAAIIRVPLVSLVSFQHLISGLLALKLSHKPLAMCGSLDFSCFLKLMLH